MSIENLIRVVPPPASPSFPFTGSWEEIEAKIRTPLPQDYKDLVRLYGAGQFIATATPFGPEGPYEGVRLFPQVYEVQRMFVEYHPEFPMYPTPGGLLVCGDVANTGYIFWLTRGPVSEWPIVVWDHDGEPELETFECDLTDFLAGVVTGEIWPKAFGDYEDYRSEKPFESFSEEFEEEAE